MPFSWYDTHHTASSNGFSTSCPAGASVRGCFQTILGQLRSQGVTGIRIFVPLCDSSSEAFNNCGSPYSQISWNPAQNQYQQQWITNVGTFFQDVANAGIQNVTITMATPGATNSLAASQTTSPSGQQCPDITPTVSFDPMVPYGLRSDNGFPIGNYWQTQNNLGYNCAPVNPFFIGWTNYFNAINAILGAAQGRVTVFELEPQQEIDALIFTANARWFYDKLV